MTFASELTDRLKAAGIPVVGVSVGVGKKNKKDKSSWEISFAPEATQAHMDAATALLASLGENDVKEPLYRPFSVALEKITLGEFTNLLTAMNGNPALMLLFYRAVTQDNIDLNASDTKDAFALVVSMGIITQARLYELFNYGP